MQICTEAAENPDGLEVNAASGFRLEETSRDLRQTRERLSEEEFICSELASTQESLYGAAGQVRQPSHTFTKELVVFT